MHNSLLLLLDFSMKIIKANHLNNKRLSKADLKKLNLFENSFHYELSLLNFKHISRHSRRSNSHLRQVSLFTLPID